MKLTMESNGSELDLFTSPAELRSLADALESEGSTELEALALDISETVYVRIALDTDED